MKDGKKLLTLAFPPFVLATSPPLGICSLKGALRSHLPSWDVRTLDLNLLIQEQIVARAGGGQGLSSLFPEGLLAEAAVARGLECFRGNNNHEFYSRPDRYSVYADFFQRLLYHHMFHIQPLERAYRNDEPVLPMVEYLANVVLASQPDAVGISLCYTQQAWMGISLGRAIKRKKNIPVIYGGTFFGPDTLNFLNDHTDAADFVITGEGELALAVLLSDMSHPENVPGLSYRSAKGLEHNQVKYAEDLDELGFPDFSDLELRRYFSPEPVLPVITSRGCYWRKCAFCTHYKSAGLTYRRYSTKHVVAELQRHQSLGISNFALVDEMISPPAFDEIADAIQESGLSIRYYALAKPVKEFTAERLTKIHSSGCRYILWGVESGSQRLLDLMNKGTKITEVSGVLQDAQAAGIFNHVFILFNFPTEDLTDFKATLTFLSENRNAIYGVQNCLFNLTAGSPVFCQPEKYGVSNITKCGDYRSGDGYEYECDRGLKKAETEHLISRCARFLGSFNPYTGAIQNYRDHALLIYGKHGRSLEQLPRLNVQLDI